MTTATDTPTVVLVHSTSGLLAEIHGLPPQVGPEYLAQPRLRESAEAVLHAQYPQLVIQAAWSVGVSGYVFRVEPI
jgi:hypothetical protein